MSAIEFEPNKYCDEHGGHFLGMVEPKAVDHEDGFTTNTGAHDKVVDMSKAVSSMAG